MESIRELLDDRSLERVDLSDRIPTAVALVLAPDAEDALCVLLIKRTSRSDDPWSGHMALPGGRMEEGDRDLLVTAIRETNEETRIGLEESHLLGELADYEPGNPLLPPVVIRPYVFGMTDRPEVDEHPDEVDNHFWVPLHDLAPRRTSRVIEARGHTLEAHGFPVGPHFVWGITERILTPFLHLIGHMD
ncbi:MAG: CoA pyrophosphatase [bacterium]